MNRSQQQSRGVTVWGERLRDLRKRRGWTQTQLADRSGYCDRLIRKAEQNGSVSEETLEVLAITLSTKDCIISAEDLSLSSRITANLLSQAILNPSDTGLQQVVRHAQPNIEIDCSQVWPTLPLNGLFESLRGVTEWYTTLSCLLNCGRVQIDNRVLLDNVQHGFLHASCLFSIGPTDSIPFDIDLRFELCDSLVQRVYWLSSLKALIPFESEWDQMIKLNLQKQIQRMCEDGYAEASA
jgi:transcriptional regulator with XRE-family HTH domain